METFSQRKGLKPVKSIMQVDSMDDDLRNRLWNALTAHYWTLVEGTFLSEKSNGYINIRLENLWDRYFKKPTDTLPDFWQNAHNEIRSYFSQCMWYEVYDFVQFMATGGSENYEDEEFTRSCNDILKEEMSAYRFVAGKVTQMTSEEEIAEVEKALKTAGPITSHLSTALSLLSDKKSPDYRNSIKESISAVEAMCQLITGDEKATLSHALKQIQKDGKVKLHSAFSSALDKLYGYSSDADGIRHALSGESNLDAEDAIFMLVSCSAFINYLKVKASKAGLRL